MNRFDQSLSFIHWPLTDLIRCAIAVIVFAIISIIALTSNDGPRIAAGVFGLVTAALFGYDAFLIIPSIRTRQHAPAPRDSVDT
ncbi:proteolipid protein 2-like [Chiloscyllium punctatum]|uniref:proteolipid protein 2-like n=1 Tax=Chiloscyllium punctatum TaxID=137246 RepID=UPI003B64220D